MVKLIRRNILQTPKSTWADKAQQNQTTTAGDTTTETPKREVSITEQNRQTSNKFPKKDFIAKNREALNKVRKLDYDEDDGKDNAPSPNRRRSRNSSTEERLVRSTTLFDNNEFRPNRRKSSEASHSIEDVTLNPEMLAEIIKYYKTSCSTKVFNVSFAEKR